MIDTWSEDSLLKRDHGEQSVVISSIFICKLSTVKKKGCRDNSKKIKHGSSLYLMILSSGDTPSPSYATWTSEDSTATLYNLSLAVYISSRLMTDFSEICDQLS